MYSVEFYFLVNTWLWSDAGAWSLSPLFSESQLALLHIPLSCPTQWDMLLYHTRSSTAWSDLPICLPGGHPLVPKTMLKWSIFCASWYLVPTFTSTSKPCSISLCIILPLPLDGKFFWDKKLYFTFWISSALAYIRSLMNVCWTNDNSNYYLKYLNNLHYSTGTYYYFDFNDIGSGILDNLLKITSQN